MAQDESVESPIHAAAEVADERITEMFSLLGDATRVAILLALAQADDTLDQQRWSPSEVESRTFSELRNQIGVDDPGNFNYHLGELEGQFIRQTAEGYELLPAGNRIVRTVITVAGFEEITLPQTEIDLPCPNCGDPTVITHRHQRMYHLCTACEGNVHGDDTEPSGILSAIQVDRSILEDRTPAEIVVTHYLLKCQSFLMDLQKVCPMCAGRIDAALHICEDHDTAGNLLCPVCGYRYAATGRFNCRVCTHGGLWGIIELSSLVPAGIDLWLNQLTAKSRGDGGLTSLTRLFDLYEAADLDVVERDPPRVRVTLRDGEITRHITFDEHVEVVAVDG